MSTWARSTQQRRRAARRRDRDDHDEPLAVPRRPPVEGRRLRPGEKGWIDLVHHEPLVPVAVDVLRRALRFAFESGDAGGLLSLAVDEAPIAPSTWDPDLFVDSLFLPELLRTCFAIEIGGARFEPSSAHLLRLLSHPPSDARDVRLRQDVLRELEEAPALRACLERTYAALRHLRSLLDEQPLSPGETIRRKIEVLTQVKVFFDESAEGLASATSALARLHQRAVETRQTEAWTKLEQLLDFDGNMMRAEVRVTLGSDGRIRDYELLESRDNLANPLVRPWWRRAWSQLAAWMRGHRYGENEVLLKVVDGVFKDLEDAILPLFQLAGDLELYLCALAFRDRAARDGLATCLPELVDAPEVGRGPCEVEGLFNPLLFLQDVVPVPCSVRTSGHDAIVVVTGPNSGGKTRVLQALALMHALGHAGIFVPAAKARITRAPSLFVSLVEGGYADQKEGRLGTELVRVRKLFERVEPGALVMLDELCSGTNPSEGIAIFEMVISLLPRLRPQAFLTTHFLDAARKLEDERPVERLEFLQVELDGGSRPTYQFVAGVASTSLAHQLAARLGVTREELEALVSRHE